MRNFPSVLEKISDLKREEIDGLLTLANKFKKNPDVQHGQTLFLGKKPVVANSFLESSTRTRNSFALAIHKLGCTYLDFNAETSSLKKGEGLDETLLTLYAQGVDLCIVRSSQSYELSQFRDNPPLKIINGGDGTHQHPTQALLDLMTMLELCPDLDGKTVTIIGDCHHSRVTHSLIELLPMYGAKVVLCGPPCFQIPTKDLPAGIEQSDDIEACVKRSDFIYLLRIQRERHKKNDIPDDQLQLIENYFLHYGLDNKRLSQWNKQAPIFHPGPANIGVEISSDLIKSQRYKGYLQVVNSIFMRMAIIASILQNADKNIGCINGVSIRQ